MSSTAAEVSVSTVAAAATSTGHHMLKIEGYELLKRVHGNGQYLESCRFMAAGHSWKLFWFPNGYGWEDEGFVSLRLKRDDDDRADAYAFGRHEVPVVHAEVRFELLDHHSSSRLLRRRPKHARSFAAAFCRRNDEVGCDRFITVQGLESRFLKDDCLAVRCDITVVDKSAVEDEVVKAPDMERMGMLSSCKCKDDLCKRHHAETTGKKIRKAFVTFFRSTRG